MCGIAGLIGTGAEAELRARVGAMTAALTHRGPDHGAVTAGPGVALGYRRLAVHDLSPAGHQPMATPSGRHVLVYNGEIYGFDRLREALKRSFRGDSDTEVLLAALDEWGLADTLTRLDGDFAFALWDRRERTVTLVRDRMGVKPLYTWDGPGGVAFASEIKAFGALPGWSASVDAPAAADYFRLGYVPGARTGFVGVRKLLPGHWLRIRCGGAGPRPDVPRRYWSLAGVVETERGRGPDDEDAALTAVESALTDAVRERLVADVPVGVFLSGGIDSSLLAAVAARLTARPLVTFTIGFADPAFDESPHARAVADFLGAEHHERIVTGADLLEHADALTTLHDEPFADTSTLPTLLLARLARPFVTVALAGDGGDELFGGYARHVQAARLARLRLLPRPLRHTLASAGRALPPEAWDRLARLAGARRGPGARWGDRIHKAAALLRAGSGAASGATAGKWETPPLRGVDVSWEGFARRNPDPAAGLGLGPAEAEMLADGWSYLPNDPLAKTDRATMAVGLEARVPFLDRAVVSLAWSLPLRHRVRRGAGKWLLRELLARHLPRSLWDRPKTGFGVPIAAWLRGPLRSWADELIGAADGDGNGLVEAAALRQERARLDRGDDAAAQRLWIALAFLAWQRHWHATL